MSEPFTDPKKRADEIRKPTDDGLFLCWDAHPDPDAMARVRALRFSDIPADLRALGASVPDLDTPVWYSGSLDQRFNDGEANTHWWERLRKRLRRVVGK